MTKNYDIVVIGAGIAGSSVAAVLAEHASVLLIEKEQQPGYHSTGRSAAMYIPSYGPPFIQALTKASGEFFKDPPSNFCNTSLLSPRAEMLIARTDQLAAIDLFMQAHAGNSNVTKIDANEIQSHCPLLKRGYAAAGILDTSGSDIDVNALHQGYLKKFKQHNGTLILNSHVNSLKAETGGWLINAGSENYTAGILVNAAGAWADEIGLMASAENIGLQPMRRTALTINAPAGLDLSSMPLVADIDEAFYIKPEAKHLLLSPANVDPMPPCDVQPDEMDIAVCIDEVERAFDIKVRTIVRSWAGLRSFVSDKEPVAGFSAQADNFFWLAAQGGYGIQSCPALSRFAASLILGNSLPHDLIKFGLNADSLGVARLF